MLDIGNSNADFMPWVKYNAKAGRWYVKGANGDQEVSNPVFVADFSKIKTGWIYFTAGGAPEMVWDPSLNQRAEKPQKTYVDAATGKTRECFKRGFSLNLFSAQSFGGVVELAATADIIAQSIKGLFAQYDAAPEKSQGLLPVVAFRQAKPVTGKHGTNYEPVFEIVKWVPRPPEFDAAPETQAPAPSQNNAPPPAAAVSSGASEF